MPGVPSSKCLNRRGSAPTWPATPPAGDAIPHACTVPGSLAHPRSGLMACFAVRPGEDGVPPNGVGAQGGGIRRSETVTAPDRTFNPLQRDASWVAASTEIAMDLEPERGALDPLHHFVGHDSVERRRPECGRRVVRQGARLPLLRRAELPPGAANGPRRRGRGVTSRASYPYRHPAHNRHQRC